MSHATDRILALLDNATQSSSEADEWGTEPDICWRCEALPAEANGLCEECLIFLSDESNAAPEPAVMLHWSDGSEFVEYPESGWRITTPDPPPLPSLEDVARANRAVREAIDRLRGAMEVVWLQVTEGWEATHRE